MKKMFAILLAFAMLLSLAACGGKTAEDPNAGKYLATTAKVMGMTMEMSEIYPGDNWVELKSGGKGTITLENEGYPMKWALEGETLTITIDGVDSVGTLKDNLICIDFMNMGCELSFLKEGAEAPAPKATYSDAGYWEIVRVESDDPESVISEEDMAIVKEYGVMMYMDLRNDGTGILYMEEEMPLTWVDGTVTFTDDGMSVAYTLENGEMVLDMFESVFVLRKSEKPAGTTSESSGQNAGEAGIYEGTTYEYAGSTFEMAQIYDDLCTIELKSDGTAMLTLDGEEMECTWTLDGEDFVLNYYTMASTGTLKDGVITIDYMGMGMLMSFVKTEGASGGADNFTDIFPSEFIAEHEGDWHGMAIVYDGTGDFADELDEKMEIIARLVFRDDGTCQPYLACAFNGKDNNFKNLSAEYKINNKVLILSGEFVNSTILDSSYMVVQKDVLYADIFVEDEEGNTMNLYACMRRLDAAWDYNNDWLNLPKDAVAFYKGKTFLEIAELFKVDLDEIPALNDDGGSTGGSGVGVLDFETIAEVYDWVLDESSAAKGYQKIPYDEIVARMGGVEGEETVLNLWNDTTRIYKWSTPDGEDIQLTFRPEGDVWVKCGATNTTAFMEIYGKYHRT